MNATVENNRRNLYNSLLSQGFFTDEDGNVEMTLDDFNEMVDDEENAINLYENLVEAEVLVGEDGKPLISQKEFLKQILGKYTYQDYYPLTENQRGVYVDWEMHRDTTQYNIPTLLVVDGMDADRLVEALKTVISAHPYLNTRFGMADGDVVQYKTGSVAPVVSLNVLNEEPEDGYFSSLVKPFDVTRDRLYRVSVIKTPKHLYIFKDIHHLIFDGASNFIFQNQVMKAYNGDAIEEEKYTALDYAKAEQEYWQSGKAVEAEKYFDSLIDGVETTVYPHVEGDAGDAVSKYINVNIPSQELKEYCKVHNITENSYFLTLFMYALHRITREENIIITTIFHGRTDMRMTDTFGMFVKTQPVVGSFPLHDENLAEKILDVQRQLLRTQIHDVYSFTKIAERYGIRAEIMFAFQGGLDTSEGQAKECVINTKNTAKVPLNLMILPTGKNEYQLHIEYNAAIYSPAEMKTLGNMLVSVYTEAPNQKRLSDISMISKIEKGDILRLSAGRTMTVDADDTYLKHFIMQAEKHPDTIAVRDAVSLYTYSELDKYSNAFAKKLVNDGVKPNQFVCILMDRCKEFVLSVISIHKAGAAYTPLDIDYPADRLQYMLEDSESLILITTHADLDKKQAEGLNVDDSKIKVIYVDDLHLSLDGAPVNLTTPQSLAYMIYTSGSTGKPKGVMLHQKGLMNFTQSIAEAEELSGDDRIASHRSYSFDAHIGDIYPILFVGGELHIMPSEIRKDLDAMYKFIVERKITGFGGTTSLMMLLINNYDLPLRFITAGGEKLSGVSSDKIRIINLYGPTECTNDSTLFVIKPGEIYDNIPIGRPLPNVSCYIMDKTGHLLPQGVAGELCITGAQVGYGYWHLPEKTAEAFAENPFGEGKLYHTGDLARYNAAGQIEYMGRIDSQVKLRGFRIELGEIEADTMQHDAIRQAVALVKEVNGSRHLVLYYTLEEGKYCSDEELAEYLDTTSLAKYMHPEIYMLLDAMPLLPNGKINRRALPVPEISAENIVAPETEMEKSLFTIFSELLKTEQFGVTTSLISVGMTSLLAMKASALIQQRLSVTINTKEILQKGTIRQLVSTAMSVGKGLQQDSQLHLKVHERRDIYPITENQRGVYVDWEMNRETTQYNMPSLITIDGMDAGRLVQALKTVISAHPYLNTHFGMGDGDIMQYRVENTEPVVDFITMDNEPDESYFKSLVKPFDVSGDRLYRISVIKTPQHLHLFKDMHHLIFDGGSNLIFLEQMMKAYSGEKIDHEEYTAFDHALDEQDMVHSEAYSEAEKYFGTLVADAETAMLPQYGQPDTKHGASKMLDVDISRSEIDIWCKRHNITVNSFFLTAIMQVLHRLLRDETISITSISNGRAQAEMQDIVGMFVKTLPVVSKRQDKKSVLTFADVASDMQQQFIESQARDFYPFTNIVEKTGLKPHVMFIYQGGMAVSEDTMAMASQAKSIDMELDTVKVPVAIMITEAENRMYHLNIQYSAFIYSKAAVELFQNMLLGFIRCVLNSGDAMPVTKVEVMDSKQINDTVQMSFGGTLARDDSDTFVARVMRQAAAQPAADAVFDTDGSITYSELETKADCIAEELIRNIPVLAGKGHEPVFVGIMMPRCKEFLVAVLGVMKAGAAYVPIDMEYPKERIDYMVENSGAKVVITKEWLDTTLTSVPSTSNHINNAHAGGLAYMIYTSGSTGLPKGVMQSHRSLNSFLTWRLHDLGLDATCRLAQHASFSFDASLDDLLCPLAAGGQVHILSEEIRKDMDGMARYFRDNGITGMTLSTQMGMAMLNTYSNLPLKFLMMGGEKMLPFKKTPVKVINGYGPTEFTVCSSYHVVDQDKDEEIPIGKAVPNTWSLICDDYGNILPQGAVGEILLAGPQIAEGYWKREDQTVAKFITNKYVNGRCYRTGDLGRYNVNGELEYCGRIDFMVKLRGFRIELGEIEKKASTFESIMDVAAEVREVCGIQHLVLYYSTEDNVTIDEQALKEHLAASLTEYMVPTIYMHMDQMPLTPNGKINRKALPAPALDLALENLAPDTMQEKHLLDICQNILGRDDFGVTDNLKLLGLTSLAAIKVAAQAVKLGITIKVADIMKSHNIREVLSMQSNFTFWANEQTEGKPVVIIILGVSAYQYTQDYIEALTKHFSVYVIESIVDHYDAIFKGSDVNEVTEMYYSLLDFCLPENTQIYAFTGHSFGGELAYRVACRWQKETGQHPKIMMLDTIWTATTTYPTPLTRLIPYIPDSVNKYMEDNMGGKAADMEYNNRLVASLMTDEDPLPYDGTVILQKAIKKNDSGEILMKAFDAVGASKDVIPDDILNDFNNPGTDDNETFWRNHHPALVCHHIDDVHMGILKKEYADTLVNDLISNE